MEDKGNYTEIVEILEEGYQPTDVKPVTDGYQPSRGNAPINDVLERGFQPQDTYIIGGKNPPSGGSDVQPTAPPIESTQASSDEK